jgi:DNA (cytosine-5)-methyltransferase 1
MIYGSVCSGIEAASVAWHPLGWRPAFFSEIEAFPRAVLAQRWPGVPVHGDFTTIEAGQYEPIDLLVGGTPCQDFSVAGLRAGLDGERGRLTLEFFALARRLRPRWVVWENVPGVLSMDEGRVFGLILGLLGQCGFGFAYRVLDAQYFRVPQRRRRVFIVGYLGDWRRAAAVLFERESLSGDPPPSREAGERVAQPIAAGSPTSYRVDADTAENLIAPPITSNPYGDHESREGLLVASTLEATAGRSRGAGTPIGALAFGGNDTRGAIDVATAVNAHGGPHGRLDFASETLVAVPIQESGRRVGRSHDDARIGLGVGDSGDPMFTLGVDSRHAIAFTSKDHGQDAGDLAPTLRSMAGKHANAGGQVAVALHARQDSFGEAEQSPPIDTDPGTVAVRNGATVRRVTPRECERLQGLPDDYTLITYRGKPAADGPRYKALGNSMAVPCMRWIGERIAVVDRLARAA